MTGDAYGSFLDVDAYLPPDDAWQHIYQVWHVFDPSRVPVGQDQFTYLDWTRFGIDNYTAELQVHMDGHGSESEIFLSVDFLPAENDVAVGFLIDEGEVLDQIDDLCMGTRVSMSVRDRIWLNTTTRRPPVVSDLLKVGQFSLDDWVTSYP